MGAPRGAAAVARWLRLLLGLCAWAPRVPACPRLCACPAPGAVHCPFRYFSAVPARIPAGARRINLGYNSLLQLTEKDFSGLEKLELLMLHSNEINSIPDKVFRDLHSLQVLKMSYNKVRVLQRDAFHGLKSLARLHMDHNRIEFVHPNVFYGLTSLRLVHLEGNLLKQLHPDTFVTLRYIEIFKASSIKQIYLSDNLLTSLPQEVFSHLSELESIYLHGNPWSCDCNLQGLAAWARQRPDVIKCKTDRSSSSAQQCPACTNPQNSTGKNLADIPAASLVCTKPAIHHSLKLNTITLPDDGDFSSLSPEDFIAPIGSMVLNMTDQAGSQGNLVCNIQKPKETSPISFDKDGNNTVLKVSFSALLVCDISYENIQQLWSILALYSNSPLELERTVLLTKMPFTSYKYKQIYSEKNDLFTNIETELRAEPSWLMQNKIALQLDRTATTLNTLHIQYFTDAQIILPSVDNTQVRNGWTIISKDNNTRTQHTVLVGGTVDLECRATGEPAPAIEWILADGSKVRAPYISEDGRIIVVKTGTLTLRTADSFDTGLYHCIGTNVADADILTFRITVVDPYEEHPQVNGAQLSTFIGGVLHLPCPSTAVPHASISWVLPERVILHDSVRNKHIFENGTLKIQSVTKQDRGYFRCVAANQYGVDLLVFQVHVKTDETTPQKNHVAVGQGEVEEGSGNVVLAPFTRWKNSLASLATAPGTAPREPTTPAAGEQTSQSTSTRNSYGKTSYRRHRDKASRRLRGHRRQFLSSARRADPQRWAALLEKTRRNLTLTEKQTTVPTNLSIQALKSSKVSEEEEASGDPTSPEPEPMILATKTPSVSPLGEAMENTATAALPTATRSTPARKTSLRAADAATPPASPAPQSVSPGNRRPQTYLEPTVTNPKSQERSDLSQIPVNATEQSTVSYGASRTSTVFNAGHRLVSSEESNSQYLRVVSVTPMVSAAATSKHVAPVKSAEKLLVFAESIDKTVTKSDPQVSVVTGNEAIKEPGYIYLHSTQKLIPPKLLGSANITHRQVQLFGDVTTHTPQARQQHGRRRKVSVRRRIIRPDRMPRLNEHRHNLGSPGSTTGRAAAVPGVRPTTDHISTSLTMNSLASSLSPHSPETPLSPSVTTSGQLEHPGGAHGNTALLPAQKTEPTARPAAASTAVPLMAAHTRADPPWKSEGSSQNQPITWEPPPRIHTPHAAVETTRDGPTPGSANVPSTAVPRAPGWGEDEDSALTASPGNTRDSGAAARSPPASGSTYPRQPAKPRIVGGKLAAFTVLANSDAFLPCEATGDPPPTIQWSKLSPGPPAADGRLRVWPNGTLSIAAARVQDGGQYACVATNRHGAARLLATLSVLAYAPRVLQPRARLLTVQPGAPVAMPCKAQGRPAPTFTWILANRTHVSGSATGNSRVSVQADGTLMIREVTVYDRGLYTCVASNPAGTDTLVVTLQVVAAPPVIVEEQRQHVEGTMGENLRLPCTAKGNPQPSVHWVLSDGTVVKPLQLVKGKFFLFSNGTLHVGSVAPADSGTYECIATSSTGSERRVVRLAVRRAGTLPRIASASQRTTRLDFGEPLRLHCTASGEPAPRVLWRLPSRAVVDQWHRMGSRIHVFPNGSLLIEAVTEKDAGDYLCVARNPIGDDLIPMKVIITMKPARIDQKQHFKKLVPYGKDFQVDCMASGLPAPEISWRLPDGTTINKATQADGGGRGSRRYVLFDNGTLYLNKAGLAEEGDYTCRAQNALGRDEMRTHVTVVTAAPRIKQGSTAHARVQAGDTALLDCEAVGDPKPKIFWLLPSSDMISFSRDRYLLHANGSLSVTRVKLLDAGEYTCVARNPGGDDTKLYKVDVVSKPPTINGLHANKTTMKVTAVRHAKKQIDCRAEGTPTPQIMWVMPDNIFLTAPYYGSRITVHKNGTLEIRNLRLSDTADFTCVARNDGGESVLVVQLQVLEMLRRPMFKNPFNEKVIAKPGKTNVLNCSVDGNPPPEISWMLPNGTWFPGGIRSARFLTGSNGTLTIYNTGSEDAGKYRCAARNKVGYIEKLVVLELGRKPSILVPPQGPVKGIGGELLSLHCLSEGSPKPSTAWTVPSGLVLDRPRVSGKYVLLANGTLLIRAASSHDQGTYVCTARNAAGDASVSVAVAVVAHAPRITSGPPRSVRTAPGTPIQLKCAALGAPRPQIAWELPNHSVLSTGDPGRPSGSELLHPQGTLVIPNPRPSDSGTYRCIAKNHLGSDSTVTYIHVI
ncbi:immunoglobulin superfamily member 10 [Eudromia elegans]